MIHKFPTNAKLRTLYVDLLLKSPYRDERSMLISGRIAESALALTHSELLRRWVYNIGNWWSLNNNLFNPFSNSKELSKALALISVTKEGVDARGQRIYAQKAVFVNPENKAARKALAMCRVWWICFSCEKENPIKFRRLTQVLKNNMEKYRLRMSISNFSPE